MEMGAGTIASRVLMQLSSTIATTGLTSGFGWDQVGPCRYGRLGKLVKQAKLIFLPRELDRDI